MAALSGLARRRASTALAIAVLVSLSTGIVVGLSARPTSTASPTAQGPAPVAPVVSITPAGPVSPASPLVVHVADGRARSVTVTDTANGTPVAGTLAPDGATWTSTVSLSYATRYAVAVDTADAAGRASHQDLSVATVAPAQQAYPSFVPPPGQATVGVGQPIVVRFSHAVHDRAAAERALQVTASPPQAGGWNWLSDTEVHYRPQGYWAAGSTITIAADLFGVDLGRGVFGQTNRSETIHVHDAWVAKADGVSEQMQIFQNGTLVKTMPISLGSPGHPSHVGPHVISDKQPSIIMDSCTYGVCQGQPGYYREQVNLDERISDDGEFVHSAPWSVGSQGGANVSHGCVNLSPANAQWFFDHFGIGDVVEIANSGGPQLPLGDTYGDWELSWAQWQKGSAA